MTRATLLVALAACRYHFDDLPDGATCTHTFCDDFERASLLGPWDSSEQTGGSTVAIDSGTLLATGVTTLPASSQAYLVKNVGVATTALHIETDIELDSGHDGEIDLLQIRWLDPPPPCTSFGFFIVRDRQTNTVAMQETYGACGIQGNITTPLGGIGAVGPTGHHRLAIDIALGATTSAHLGVLVDTTPFAKSLTTYAVPPSPIAIAMGVPGVQQNTAPWVVRYDNVFVDLQ